MKRTLFTTLVALTVVVASMSGAAGATFVAEDSSKELTTVHHHGEPSYIVSLENDSIGSLENWASASSDRHVVEAHPDAGYAVVSAPTHAVKDVPFWKADLSNAQDVFSTSPLSSLSYVTNVEANYQVEVDPVRSLSQASEVPKPKEGTFQFDDPAYPTDGIAFREDANRTTMNQSRSAIGADNVSQTGAGVTVAVVDTGVNVANGQIFGNGTAGSTIRVLNASGDVTGSNVTNVTESGYSAIESTSHHGTWAASAIAANTSNATHDGIAPGASILAVKALGDDGSGSLANVVEGIRYSANNGADVISLSLGSWKYSKELADAVQYARDQGAVVVVAAGNARVQRGGPAIASPGDVDGVVTVGAVDVGSQPSNMSTVQAAYFSQVGPDSSATDFGGLESQGATVEVVAPGVRTVAMTADTDGYTQTEELSGTSMATPMVAASAALAMDAHSSWTNEKVVKWLKKGARPVPQVSAAAAGNGMVAVDNTITTTAPETSQVEAQTSSAAARNKFYQAAGESTGVFNL